MKRFAIGILAVFMVTSSVAVTRAANPRGTSEISLKGKHISVEYGQPSLKGRTTDDLLGRLKPGGIWRLGADTSTTFKTDADLMFGDVAIPAGVYSIWMQRQDDSSWKLLFDKKHGQWGEPAPDPSECFASVPMEVTKPAGSVDLVTITLHREGVGGAITVKWGTLEASSRFKVK